MLKSITKNILNSLLTLYSWSFLITDFTDYTEDIWFYLWEISQRTKLNPAKARRRKEERDFKAICLAVGMCFSPFFNH